MRNKSDIKTEIFLICSARKDFLAYVNIQKYQNQWHQMITETYLLSNIVYQVMILFSVNNPFCKVPAKVSIDAFKTTLMLQAKHPNATAEQNKSTHPSPAATKCLHHITNPESCQRATLPSEIGRESMPWHAVMEIKAIKQENTTATILPKQKFLF